MKILMVSVFHHHFFNWVLQLEKAGHEIYWFDIADSNTYMKKIDFVHQTVKWKIKIDYPGRYWIKRNLPILYKLINKFNNRKFQKVFKEKLKEIQPDVVHSFEMHASCVPILKELKKYPNIKWIYSSWGSDLYYYQRVPEKLKAMEAVFNRLDLMFADCDRDFYIAKKFGFKGKYLGTFPGGGGFDIHSQKLTVKNFEDRNIILIKGYQGKFGKCNNILDAIFKIKDELTDFRLVVFGANENVLKFIEQPRFQAMENMEIIGRISGREVLNLMGKSLIYIGNSISDGIPNTLLEAIIMGSFPIQSNPGGATAEIIEHGKNGYLIENPENSNEIAALIKKAVQNPGLLKSGIEYNSKHIKPKLERNYIKEQVLNRYELIERNL
jgi:glycosyltransferase involved in cell wall biosynthesis